MEKLKNILPEIVFIAVAIRAVAIGAGLGEAIILFSLAILIGFKSYLVKGIQDDKAQILSVVEEIKAFTKSQCEITDNKIIDLANKIQSVQVNAQLVNQRRKSPNEQNESVEPTSITKKRLF